MLETALLCLSLNIYHEARGETLEGQKAVAQVTMNRAKQDPSKVCDVVFAPYQFSWANPLNQSKSQAERNAHADVLMPRDKEAWKIAKNVANKAIKGNLPNTVGQATHYHATYVSPRWAKKLQFVKRIGTHLFYENT